MHLLIIDALNLIRRIHAVQGTPCYAACCQTIRQLLHFTHPTHAVMIFDAHDRHSSWRYQLFPVYKSGRTMMPADLIKELPTIIHWVENSLGIVCWQIAQYEADDVIATIAYKTSQQGHKVTLISTDKGFCQLINPAIQIRDYFQKRWLDFTFVQRTFNVSPAQLTDYWGLVGIAGSKLPGVPGVGGKTAAQLLSTFKNIDAIYESLSLLSNKIAIKLEQHQQQARLCRTLASLKTDLVLQGNLQQLRLSTIPILSTTQSR